jgi:cell division protein FtsI/penicillin-binding protein 2
MKKGRKLIVHSRFQFKKAFIIGVAILILSGVGSLAIYYVSYQNNIRLTQIIGEQNKYDEVQIELYRSLIYVSTTKSTTFKISVDKVESDMKANSDRIKSTIAEIDTVKRVNSRLILAAVVFSAVQLLVVFYLILRHTSGVSGQMFLLNRYLDEILAGKKPAIRTLRDGDDFHEVFEKLSEVVKRV